MRGETKIPRFARDDNPVRDDDPVARDDTPVAGAHPCAGESGFSIANGAWVTENLWDGRIAVKQAPALSAPGFGSAWFALCVAFALHIIDEASTGFLAVYNPTVAILRERWSGFPMPTLEFREWLVAMIVACALLFCLTPLAGRGMRGLRPLAWLFAVIMFLNGLGHTLFSILGHTVS